MSKKSIPNDAFGSTTFDEPAKRRRPGEGRGPVSGNTFRYLDTGFRRYDVLDELLTLYDVVNFELYIGLPER
jgi:hypothetical protein